MYSLFDKTENKRSKEARVGHFFKKTTHSTLKKCANLIGQNSSDDLNLLSNHNSLFQFKVIIVRGNLSLRLLVYHLGTLPT